MSVNHDPIAITIVCAPDIGAEYIGHYVSQRASDILKDFGQARYNPKSVVLRPISERVWYLSFQSTSGDGVKELTQEFTAIQKAKMGACQATQEAEIQLEGLGGGNQKQPSVANRNAQTSSRPFSSRGTDR